MAETKITSAQTANDVWTSTNLTAGQGIQIAAGGAVTKEVTGFSSSSYIKLPSLDFTGANTFDFTYHIKTGSLVTGAYNPVQSIYSNTFPRVVFAYGTTTDSKLVYRFYTSSSSGVDLNSLALTASTEYWFKFGLDGNSKAFLLQGTNKDNMTLVAEETTSLRINSSMDLAVGAYTYWSPIVPWNGSIWISDLKINKNGATIFDGSTDSYTVVGSPTIIDNPISDIYSISLQAAGYDATKTQVLKNVNGTLTWVDEA